MRGGNRMKSFLLRFFTWWNGQTFGTQLWTWRHGELVGQDEFGNRYYRTRGGKIDKTLKFERRWVVYSGYAEPSTVPPSWHGWLHHTVDTPPSDETYHGRSWQKPHRPNLTGTPAAYRPSGSTLAQGRRPRATSNRIQVSMAAADAVFVVATAAAATALAASDEPALKPNQPNQSIPVPSST